LRQWSIDNRGLLANFENAFALATN